MDSMSVVLCFMKSSHIYVSTDIYIYIYIYIYIHIYTHIYIYMLFVMAQVIK